MLRTGVRRWYSVPNCSRPVASEVPRLLLLMPELLHYCRSCQNRDISVPCLTTRRSSDLAKIGLDLAQLVGPRSKWDTVPGIYGIAHTNLLRRASGVVP